MIKIYKEILDSIINPAIIADADGNIIKANKPARSLYKFHGGHDLKTLRQLDPSFNAGAITEGLNRRKLKLRKKSIPAVIVPIKTEERGSFFLYLLDSADILNKMDFDSFLDIIDDSIVVADKNGFVDHINEAFSRLSGIDRDLLIGRDLRDCVKEELLEESLSLRILKLKKPVNMIVKYGSGKTVTYTGRVSYDKHGNIDKVISTGRDVTQLLDLESELRKTEALKNKYYARLQEFEEIFGAEKIVCSSDKMKNVLRVAVKAAKSDSPVLIWGESGAGKELIAKVIHNGSSRKQKPFLAVNCAAIPSELLESEFFGYDEGAFTGAKRGGKKGLFEEADGGTVLLDEIGELPLNMQSKLLRVLQESEMTRIGSSRAIPVNVRVISSTNLSREKIMDDSRFRQDLFYRLTVVPIRLPPLRERREDILPLAHYFLKNKNAKYNKNVKLSKRLMAKLYGYDWPGNVRELKNVIERLVILYDSDEIGEDAYDYIDQLETETVQAITVKGMMPLKQAARILEDVLIKAALKESGTIAKAARFLEIAPSTIHRKIKKGVFKP
ncbi:MAG: sigma-54 interaction domain-containing protein [Syntrophales bacterium]